MRTRVQVESQVEEFVKSLAPEPRHRLRRAIKALANDAGDTKRLEGQLAGYTRLRVAGHRVIFAERMQEGVRVIDCIFAEKRAVVYEMFVRLLSEGIVREGGL